MSTTFHFLDKDGKRLFRRSDASTFVHYCESMTFEGEFPCTGNRPSAGMLIAWQDVDEAWEVHEIQTCEIDSYGAYVAVTGSHIALVELSSSIADLVNISKRPPKEAIDTVIGKQTLWSVGTLPAAAADSTDQKVRYKCVWVAYLYPQPSVKTRALGYLRYGGYCSVIEKGSDGWWKVQTTTGLTGWVNQAERHLKADGFVGDEDRTVTISNQKWISVWEHINSIEKATAYLVCPRVTMDNSGITGRYIDFKRSDPEYRGVRISCSTNISDAVVRYDTTELYTAMIGIGANDLTFKNVAWTKAGGYPVDKPSQQAWVGLDDAKALWGHNGTHRTGVVTFDEETLATELLKKTYDFLLEKSTPKITVDGTISELYALGYGGEPMRLYDSVQVIMDNIGVRLEMRITSLQRDLVMPERTRVVIGSMLDDDLIGQLSSAAGTYAGSATSGSGGSGSSGTIADGSVSTLKLADGCVTEDKLGAELKAKLGL